jgi:hypothetical protein
MTYRSTSSREEDILFLETAAATEEASPEYAQYFETLLDVFGLPLAYKNILVRVLKEGSWRTSDSPIETVWRATMNAAPRRAIRRDVLRRDEEGRNRRREKTGGYSPETLGWLDEMSETSGLIRNERGVWRQGGGRAETRLAYYDRPRPIKHVPADLRTTSVADSREVPDWTKIAERARLDEWETRALHAMARGETCYGAMQELEGPADKRAMEAAWRRLKRNLDKVRNALAPTVDTNH